MSAIQYANLAPGSTPAPLDVWRVTVERDRTVGDYGLEILSLSTWDTSVEKVATDWALRIHRANLGVVRAEPIISESAGLFVVDMQFDSASPLVPASVIASRWADHIGSVRVIRLERVSAAGQSGAAAVSGQEQALGEGERAATKEGNPFVDGLASVGKWGSVALLGVGVLGLVYVLRKGGS